MGCGVSRETVDQNLSDNKSNGSSSNLVNGETHVGVDLGQTPTHVLKDINAKERRNGDKTKSEERKAHSKDADGSPNANEEQNDVADKDRPTKENEVDRPQNTVENAAPCAQVTDETTRKSSKVVEDLSPVDLKCKFFLEKAAKVINDINNMTVELEEMPSNYEKAKTLRQIYHKARYDHGEEFCRKLLDSLIEIGLVPCIRDAFQKLQNAYPTLFAETADPQEEFSAFPYPKLLLENYNPPEKAVGCVWIKLNSTVLGITDLHERCRVQAGEQGLLDYFLIELLPTVSVGMPTSNTMRGKVLENSMSAIYNCSISPANYRYFEKHNTIETLMSLRQTTNEKLNMSVLFILAYVVDEKNDDELLLSNEDTIGKIISFINNAVTKKSRRYKGMSTTELAKALKRVAANDQNKRIIGMKNGFPALMKIFTSAKTDEERISALKAVWMLVFDEENKKLFRETEGALDQILAYSDCENNKLRKVISGISWELRVRAEQIERAMSSSDLTFESCDTCNHVMISYSWNDQRTMLKVRDALKKEGYKVWMDVDKLGGSTLQAMAQGVENAAAVLIGVSREYKLSTNCRSEAEYAFQLKKDIIPLMLESHYQPDGWLGLVVGAKFWLDFTQKTGINESLSKLSREIGERGRAGNEIIKAIDELDLGGPPLINAKTKKLEVSKWGQRLVKRWFEEKKLQESWIKRPAFERLTGKRLLMLREMYEKSPDFYYRSMKADFGFPDVLAILDFTDALQNLPSNE